MANITLDFSTEKILHPARKENITYTYKDIGTAKMNVVVDSMTKTEYIDDTNSSNTDTDAIKESLNNIFTFKNGEKILDPEFGVGPIYEMLYTPFDKYTTQKMISTLKSIIATYEPRIQVTSMPVTYDEEALEYSITINYYIPALNLKDTYQVSLYQ